MFDSSREGFRHDHHQTSGIRSVGVESSCQSLIPCMGSGASGDTCRSESVKFYFREFQRHRHPDC